MNNSPLPDWVDKDVTAEKKYTNSNLAVKPIRVVSCEWRVGF